MINYNMDYDKIFEGNIDKKFFYTDYPGNKMVVGKISLKNALERLSKNEYYVLVTYGNGENLPKQYIPLRGLTSDDETLFATFNPGIRFNDICQNGGIQVVSRLVDLPSGSANYLLGPGPETVSQEELIMEQYNKFYGKSTKSK